MKVRQETLSFLLPLHNQLCAIVLEGIISLLNPQSITSLASTCKLFHQLAASDQVWAAAIYKKFGFKVHSSRGFPQRFYKYGKDSKGNKIKEMMFLITFL